MGVRDRIAKAVMGIKAYHSSPHDFDRFDLSKIGTGEGAQMYGHGIYAAENPAVSGQGGQYWNQFKNRTIGDDPVHRRAFEYLTSHGFDREAAAAGLEKFIQNGASPRLLPELVAARDRLVSGAPVGPRTYELNIKADPAQMLDWDKPFRLQSPHVQSYLEQMKVPPEAVNYYHGPTPRPTTGEEAYRALELANHQPGRGHLDRAFASQALNEAGIPGIKYLDAGSRGTGTGSSNYVIFDPSIIDITKKYAIPGAIAAPVMGAIGDQTQYQEAQ